MAALLVQSTSV